MRFLRFAGQRPMEFRKYIFNYYLYRFGLMYYTMIAAALCLPIGVLFGWKGVGWIAAAYAASLIGLKIFRFVRFRIAIAKAIQPIQPPARG
jgi:hypothetical protein